MLSREVLQASTKPQLQQMLVDRGASYKQPENKDTLINRLLEIDNTCQPSDRIQPIEEQEADKPKIVWLTKEEVLELVKPLMIKGMKARFTDSTWEFNFGGKYDSGSLSCPDYVIYRCACGVMR